MAIGDPFTADIPAIGASGTQYASDVNDLLQEIVDRLNVEVPVGSIAPADAALDMNNEAVKNAEYVGFYEQASTPSGAPYGRLEYFGDEFYAVTAGGVVQLTDAGSVNVTVAGGFGGDYGAGPEQARFVNATETYEFYDDYAQTQWGLLKARGVDIIDETAGFRTRLTSATTIAADQAYVLPPADPASGVSLLTINSSGQILLAENSAPTNSYTSVLPKHGDIEVMFAPSTMWATSGSPAALDTTSGVFTDTVEWAGRVAVPPVPVGRRLKGVKVSILQVASSTCNVNVYPVAAGSVGAAIGTGSSGTNGYSTVTITTTATTVAFGTHFLITVGFTGGAAGARSVLGFSFTYDYV